MEFLDISPEPDSVEHSTAAAATTADSAAPANTATANDAPNAATTTTATLNESTLNDSMAQTQSATESPPSPPPPSMPDYLAAAGLLQTAADTAPQFLDSLPPSTIGGGGSGGGDGAVDSAVDSAELESGGGGGGGGDGGVVVEDFVKADFASPDPSIAPEDRYGFMLSDALGPQLTVEQPPDSGEDKPAFSAEVADIINQIRAKKVTASGTPTPPIWAVQDPISTATAYTAAEPSADPPAPAASRPVSSRGRGGRRAGASIYASPAGRGSWQSSADTRDVSARFASGSSTSPNTVRPPRGRGGRPRGSSRGRGRGRGSRGGRGAARGGGGAHAITATTPTAVTTAAKRKRSMDDLDDDEDDYDDGDADDSDESEHFTPITITKSGRKVSQVLQSAPPVKVESDVMSDEYVDSEPPTPITPSSRGGVTPHYMSGRGRGGRGRGRGRGRGGPGSRGGRGGGRGASQNSSLKTPGAASVCKSCARPHSPATNAIVFCDGCNKGWHQYCHNPPVPQAVLVSPDAPWFCADCTVLREERERFGMFKNRSEGTGLSLLEKKKYLSKLDKDELVGMVIHACSVNPNLAIFGKEAYKIAGRLRRAGDDELLPYPKAGNGVKLKPESEDENLLIDDDKDVYSHSYGNVEELIATATGDTRMNGVTVHEASVEA